MFDKDDHIDGGPGQFVALPLGLDEDQDLGAVSDLLQQPSQLGLLLVVLADVHDLGRRTKMRMEPN